jgi:hypothetical protein
LLQKEALCRKFFCFESFEAWILNFSTSFPQIAVKTEKPILWERIHDFMDFSPSLSPNLNCPYFKYEGDRISDLASFRALIFFCKL